MNIQLVPATTPPLKEMIDKQFLLYLKNGEEVHLAVWGGNEWFLQDDGVGRGILPKEVEFWGLLPDITTKESVFSSTDSYGVV